MSRVFPVAALVVSAVIATGGPALAQIEEAEPPRDQIVLSGDVLVRRGEEVGEVVVLRGTVEVGGIVRGDVVVIDGEVRVGGQVSGSVVNARGPVTLGESAQVLGDVVAGGSVRAAPGAQVGGDVREDATFMLRGPIEAFGRFASWLAIWASTLLLGLLLLLVAPRGAEATARTARASPWTSAGWGVAGSILLPILGILGVVSLIWLPLGLALLLSLFLLASVAVASSAFVLGRLLWREPRGRTLALLFGWAILAAVGAIPIVGGIVWALAAVFGLGALLLATWRARGAREVRASRGR
ncbi:MAG TPA: polymer-forming cytoskeletal protein, partial [Actinomycetota bacterium]